MIRVILAQGVREGLSTEKTLIFMMQISNYRTTVGEFQAQGREDENALR